MNELLDYLSKPWIQGLTLSGGHPLESENLPGVYNIVKEVKEKFPNKDVWLYTGLTLSGGHPLEFKNADVVEAIIKKVRKELPDKDIWLYTGYELNLSHFFTTHRGIAREDQHHNYIYDIIRNCDVIVDGPFINEKKDLSLRFRGSKNQRLIDVKETLKQEKIITLPEKEIIHGQLANYTI